MNNGYVCEFRDQQTAEYVASQRRIAYSALLAELVELAESTNSLALFRVVGSKSRSFIVNMGKDYSDEGHDE